MEKRNLGKSDVKITPILMGTWQAGKKLWVGIEDDDSVKAIRAAFENSNAIAGARTAKQVIDNAKAAEVKLSQDELQEIDAIGSIVTSHQDNSPVMWNW